MLDLSEDDYFSLMDDGGDIRHDLKLTDNCSPAGADAVRELLSSAEGNGERVLVSCHTVWL